MSDGPWWEHEIARLPGIIKKLDDDISRATYGPAIRRLLQERQTWQGELNNAMRAAEAHAEAQRANKAQSGGATSVFQADAKRRKSDGSDPEVAKRRALVKSNGGVQAEEMCEIFDRENVPLPMKWFEAGFRKWSVVYNRPEYRSRIDVLISKDRQTN